jgi:hypothetical protein
MITLRDARDQLGVSYRSLEKYMRQLDITPARHTVDMRFYVLDDEQLDRLRQLVAAKRALTSTAARTQHGQGYVSTPASAPVVPARADSALRASQAYTSPEIALPGDLVTLESFCLEHGVARQTAIKGMRGPSACRARALEVAARIRALCARRERALTLSRALAWLADVPYVRALPAQARSDDAPALRRKRARRVGSSTSEIERRLWRAILYPMPRSGLLER